MTPSDRDRFNDYAEAIRLLGGLRFRAKDSAERAAVTAAYNSAKVAQARAVKLDPDGPAKAEEGIRGHEHD